MAYRNLIHLIFVLNYQLRCASVGSGLFSRRHALRNERHSSVRPMHRNAGAKLGPLHSLGWRGDAGRGTCPNLGAAGNGTLQRRLRDHQRLTPALNGTYGVAGNAMSTIFAEMISILANNTFTNGTATLAFPDTSNAPHDFTVAQFKTLATALGLFGNTCTAIMSSNAGTLPT